jgi:putative membrane protein
MRISRGLFLAATLGLGACTGQGNPSLSATDNNFIMRAASGGMAEVSLGQMAQRYSSNPAVDQFAQQMVQEHSGANQELMVLAGRKGVTPPTGPDQAHIDANRQLSQLTGPAFDQQYMLQQVQDHELQAALYRQEATSGTDPDVRAFAAKYLPVVQSHEAMAKQILQSVSVPAPPAQPAAPTSRMRR